METKPNKIKDSRTGGDPAGTSTALPDPAGPRAAGPEQTAPKSAGKPAEKAGLPTGNGRDSAFVFPEPFKEPFKAAIVGVGLIGGSFALSLKDLGVVSEVIGVDNSEANRNKALRLGLVDRCASLEEAVDAADLVVLATPVSSIPLLAVKVLNKVHDQVVIDMGSTKQELCEVIARHPCRGRFVATHPMWGTEYSGPEAAEHGAFAGRTVVICDKDLSDPDALGLIEQLYTRLGMPIKYMGAEEQDTHTAYVSHISHITSFALALTVLEKEREEEHIFDLAGGGFESTVRLAKSSPETWVPIFMQNKYNVLDVLREHIHQLQIFRKLLERDDKAGLTSIMKKANTIQRILK